MSDLVKAGDGGELWDAAGGYASVTEALARSRANLDAARGTRPGREASEAESLPEVLETGAAAREEWKDTYGDRPITVTCHDEFGRPQGGNATYEVMRLIAVGTGGLFRRRARVTALIRHWEGGDFLLVDAPEIPNRSKLRRLKVPYGKAQDGNSRVVKDLEPRHVHQVGAELAVVTEQFKDVGARHEIAAATRALGSGGIAT